MRNTMQEMNEQFKDCPFHVNTYVVDGTRCIVTSHYIGDKDINDVMMKYAEDRAMSEMFDIAPSAMTA